MARDSEVKGLVFKASCFVGFRTCASLSAPLPAPLSASLALLLSLSLSPPSSPHYTRCTSFAAAAAAAASRDSALLLDVLIVVRTLVLELSSLCACSREGTWEHEMWWNTHVDRRQHPEQGRTARLVDDALHVPLSQSHRHRHKNLELRPNAALLFDRHVVVLRVQHDGCRTTITT